LNIFFFLVLASSTIFLSTRLSIYVDKISQNNRKYGFIVAGILLAGITSLPELVTSFSAVKIGNPYLAMGDVLGSNVFNIFIMCLLNVVFLRHMIFNGLKINYVYEYLVMIISYLIILYFVIFKSSLVVFNIGFPTLFLFLFYIVYIFKISRNNDEIKKNDNNKMMFWVFKLIVCAILMIISSVLLTKVVNNISIDYPLISSSMIGAILLGITTSLPEVITFIALVKLKNYDMAVTDIVGSNIFNLFVLALIDVFMLDKPIYLFCDFESILLLKVAFIVTLINFFQAKLCLRNKFLYIIPSLMVILFYIYFYFVGFGH